MIFSSKSAFYILFVSLCMTSCIRANIFSIMETVTDALPQLQPNLPSINVIDPAIRLLVYSNVHFVLCTKDNLNGMSFQLNNHAEIPIDREKTMKVLVHGWQDDVQTGVAQTLKNEYLSKFDVNVLMVDWSTISQIIFYPLPANGTTLVGECVAELLKDIYNNVENTILDVHLIGHSLGAHVCSFAGRTLKRNNLSVQRITGLDPANPLIFNGLSVNDANFVDVIHTTAGTLGKANPLGHADFYPNGGVPPQPGCFGEISEIVLSCSHSMSWKYFAKSIRNPNQYVAERCSSYTDFLNGRCDKTAIMGEGTPNNTRGIYFLRATYK